MNGIHQGHRHYVHYVPLVGLFVFGIIGFLLFSYDKQFISGLIFALSLSYVSWGIVHHIVHKNISLAVIIEYVAVAVLGAVITLSLISRS